MSSNSVSKRRKTETSRRNDVVVNSIDHIVATSAQTTSQLKISKGVIDSFINVFTEDILPEILDNLEILTAKDLLNFRLVNRYWRDAATSVLLKQNLCEIALDFGLVAYDDNGNAVAQAKLHEMGSFGYYFRNIPSFRKYYFNVYQPKRFLSNLNQLISMSPKFPSTSICFHPACSLGFENLYRPVSDLNDEDRQNQQDLLQFFSLYGKKIKKLTFGSEISRKTLHDLLYVHMPQLISLDLQDFEQFSHHEQDLDGIHMSVCLSLPSTLGIKEIRLGQQQSEQSSQDKVNFVQELIGVCPKLSSIQNVGDSFLGVLLKTEKCHLIRALHLNPLLHQILAIQQLTKCLPDTSLLANTLLRDPAPKLSKLALQLQAYGEYAENAVKCFNIVLSTNKDSLKYLELDLNRSDIRVDLFVPPLPNLECLRLVDSKFSAATRLRFLGDVIGRAMQAGELTTDASIIDFDALTLLPNNGVNKIPADYFPNLCDVILMLDVESPKKKNSDKLIQFFSLEHFGYDGMTTICGDTLLTVTALELNTFPRCDGNMSKLFPNLTHLKIHCDCTYDLQNWVWAAFPKLERFEINRMYQGAYTKAKDMDSFFTGISPELCSKFESEGTYAEVEAEADPGHLFERTQPFIGDCHNLKEFKISFRYQLGSKFVSKVTALHGFRDVIYRTKIIFSFESVIFRKNELQETRQHLEPVAAFVEIQMKK